MTRSHKPINALLNLDNFHGALYAQLSHCNYNVLAGVDTAGMEKTTPGASQDVPGGKHGLTDAGCIDPGSKDMSGRM